MRCVIIEGRFAGLNEFISALNSRNRSVGNNVKRSAERKIMKQLQGLKPLKTPVYFSIHYFEPNRRRDPDNISGFFRKAFLDALVRGGYLPNDGFKEVFGFMETFDVDKDRPRIEVTIIEEAQKKGLKQ